MKILFENQLLSFIGFNFQRFFFCLWHCAVYSLLIRREFHNNISGLRTEPVARKLSDACGSRVKLLWNEPDSLGLD